MRKNSKINNRGRKNFTPLDELRPATTATTAKENARGGGGGGSFHLWAEWGGKKDEV